MPRSRAGSLERQQAGPRPMLTAANGPAEPAQTIRLAELVMRVGRFADRVAFAQLFEALAPKVKGYMRRLGADDAAAEDLAQDVMVTVWRRAGLFDPARATVTTWIYTIARNRRIDRLRHDRLPEPDPTADRPAGLLADQLIHLAEQERRLRQAMAALPPEQAEAIALFFHGDKTHVEIAAERGLPLGTVKSRIRLALGRLRQAMDGAAPEPRGDPGLGMNGAGHRPGTRAR